MNKTVTVNIGGLVFHIEETAYSMLQQYLNHLKQYLGGTPGHEEIIGDIEMRIAELLTSKITDNNQVVNVAMVEEVIAVLGQPEQYMAGDDDDAFGTTESTYTNYTNKKDRRIFRDEDDRVLGGVCSGLSAYFSIDPLWMRLFFVIAMFAGFGASLPIYILLWIVIPVAKTRAEKIQMRGKPVNFDNLKQKFDEETAGIKNSINNIDTRNWHGVKHAIGEIVTAIGVVLKVILKALSKVIGFAFILAGIALFTSLVILFFSQDQVTAFSFFNDFQMMTFDEVAALMVSQPADWPLIKYGIIALVLLFVCTFLFSGIKLLFNLRMSSVSGKGIEWVMVFFAIVSVVSICVGVTRTAADFGNQETISETISLDSLTADTIVVTCLPETIFQKSVRDNYYKRNQLFKIEDNHIIMGSVQLDVRRTSSSLPSLEINKSAHGANGFDARQRVKNITYNYEQNQNVLAFGPWIKFEKEDKYRDQQVSIILHLPVGKSVTLTTESGRIIDDIDNIENEFDLNMLGKTWHMTPEGLTAKYPNTANNI